MYFGYTYICIYLSIYYIYAYTYICTHILYTHIHMYLPVLGIVLKAEHPTTELYPCL